MYFLLKVLEAPIYICLKMSQILVFLVCLVIFGTVWFLGFPLTPNQVIYRSDKTVYECFGLICIETMGYYIMDGFNFLVFEDHQTTISFDEDSLKYNKFLWTGMKYVFFSACVFVVTSLIWGKVKHDQVRELHQYGHSMSAALFRNTQIGLLKNGHRPKHSTFLTLGLIYFGFEAAVLSMLTSVLYTLVVDTPITYSDYVHWPLEHPSPEVNGTHMLFPAITKCFVNVTYQSDSSEILQAMCVHHLNYTNQFFYYILLIWFLLLVVVCGSAFIFYCLFLMNKTVRASVVMHFIPVTKLQLHCLSHWSSWELLSLYQMSDEVDKKLIDVIILYIYKIFSDWY